MSRLLFFSFDDDAGPAPATVSAYARTLAQLLPPGKLWQFVGSTLAQFLEGCAVELARIHERVADLLRESEPATTVELLPEHEAEFDLDGTGTLEERQALVRAHAIRRQRYRPIDFQNALAPLFGLDPADVVVIETSHAFAASIGDVREVFRFYIYRDPSIPGAYFVESAQQLVDKIKPSHTAGHVIESVSLRYDDPLSLYDRDLFGA